MAQCVAAKLTGSIAATSAAKAVTTQRIVARPAFLSGIALRKSVKAAVPRAAGNGVISAASQGQYTAERELWYPGATAPEYLDGSLPGDFGSDPLNLGSDPELLKWFQQAELQNGRWAMLGAAGILIPEALTAAGILHTPHWYEAGAADYFADKKVLTIVQFNLMAWAEIRRWADINNPGSVNVDPVFPNNKLPDGNEVGYPGGIFDPLGYAKDSKAAGELKLKEIKNARLAMLAMLGFFFQAVYTGVGPIDNLTSHLADPGHNTIFAQL
jgi:light-harvesting complex I chlorophyll a/b binding protein 2